MKVNETERNSGSFCCFPPVSLLCPLISVWLWSRFVKLQDFFCSSETFWICAEAFLHPNSPRPRGHFVCNPVTSLPLVLSEHTVTVDNFNIYSSIHSGLLWLQPSSVWMTLSLWWLTLANFRDALLFSRHWVSLLTEFIFFDFFLLTLILLLHCVLAFAIISWQSSLLAELCLCSETFWLRLNTNINCLVYFSYNLIKSSLGAAVFSGVLTVFSSCPN